MDLHHALNAKRGKEEGELWVKLVVKAALVVKSVLAMTLVARIPRSLHTEQLLLRYQTPFTTEIEGEEPLKKFNPPKFTMYNRKLD